MYLFVVAPLFGHTNVSDFIQLLYANILTTITNQNFKISKFLNYLEFGY